MNHKQAMLAVLTGAEEQITAREFFARTMRLMHETGDPEKVAMDCGLDPDQLIQRGENFNTTLMAVEP